MTPLSLWLCLLPAPCRISSSHPCLAYTSPRVLPISPSLCSPWTHWHENCYVQVMLGSSPTNLTLFTKHTLNGSIFPLINRTSKSPLCDLQIIRQPGRIQRGPGASAGHCHIFLVCAGDVSQRARRCQVPVSPSRVKQSRQKSLYLLSPSLFTLASRLEGTWHGTAAQSSPTATPKTVAVAIEKSQPIERAGDRPFVPPLEGQKAQMSFS